MGNRDVVLGVPGGLPEDQGLTIALSHMAHGTSGLHNSTSTVLDLT